MPETKNTAVFTCSDTGPIDLSLKPFKHNNK